MNIRTGDVVKYVDRGKDRQVFNAIVTTIHNQDCIDLIGAIEVPSLTPPWAHIVERKVPRGTKSDRDCFYQEGS